MVEYRLKSEVSVPIFTTKFKKKKYSEAVPPDVTDVVSGDIIEAAVAEYDFEVSCGVDFINEYMEIGLDLISGAYFYLYLARQVFRRVAKSMPHDKLSRTTYAAIRVDADK